MSTVVRVDFNDRDARGLVPALLTNVLEGEVYYPGGEIIHVTDAEGNWAKASVVEVDYELGVLFLSVEFDSFKPADVEATG